MRQWEYRKVTLNDVPRRRDDLDLLREAGEAGWELVTIVANNVAYLKREVIAAEPDTDAPGEYEEIPSSQEVGIGAVQDEPASTVKPKYRDPLTGDTWSGRGRMATWLKRKVDAGDDIQKYRV